MEINTTTFNDYTKNKCFRRSKFETSLLGDPVLHLGEEFEFNGIGHLPP